jgi:hypothetical protein
MFSKIIENIFFIIRNKHILVTIENLLKEV